MEHVGKLKQLQMGEVAPLIFDGATIALCGSGGGLLEADALFKELEQSFLATGHPKDLTLVHVLGIGDAQEKGLQRFAHKGMVKRVIGAHWSWAPNMQALCRNNDIEAYTFPAGVISGVLRETGAGRPGFFTKVGLGTFVDPEHGGGKSNEVTKQELVEKLNVDGEDILHFKPIRVDFSFIRGSIVDNNGNLSTRHEPVDLDAYTMALAAHNCGGKVIAQVKSLTDSPILPARAVTIPGIILDHVFVEPSQEQCRISEYDPSISGEQWSHGNGSNPEPSELPFGIRLYICERAADEIKNARSANFGFGISGGIPAVLAKRGIRYWGTVEQGIHNGDMLDGEMFGAARNPQVIMSSPEQFDFFTGGGIDITFLGMGEVDREGNVNVSKIGDNLVGPGGFIDITSGAQKVVFCGTFEAKGLKVRKDAEDKLSIDQYGSVPKVVEEVSHITFSGKQAFKNGQEVVYVTERAVFKLTEQGLTLIELAKGTDLKKDVLDRLPFKPTIALESENA
ncbi:CoA-transferase [Vibrio penaeicida]|uniref:CoA-transferase n=1 Tax=Vibrio penaeicida TaxID=104609 RepID=UPI000CE9DF9A|nr:CoA-transferase [Vibrio penaeicida]